MKKFSVYANCQSVALAKTLLSDQGFSSVYKLVEIKPVHTLDSTDINDTLNKVRDLDLFIYQPFGGRGVKELSSESVVTKLPENCISLSFPPLYFDGYFPQLEMLPGIQSPLNLVHDFFILKFYLDGYSEALCKERLLSENLIEETKAVNYYERSIERLYNREKINSIDLPVSDFIRTNSRSYKLFNQFNHPRKPVFEFLKNNILDRVGVRPYSSDLDWEGPGYLDGIRCPSLSCMRNSLSFDFEDDEVYFAQGKILGLDEVIRGFYQSYDDVDRAILKNAILDKKSEVVSLLEN
ncbi:WcbI family polysaccharide biosynthesis putative acetyltransferase [Microbulbifer sp. ANSA002]|uniref:WcbI family polysaccharide biosynthesis putative acetyltransferase n=1 Tax=unclassified Microbulbifer TaxID=2619833 RepID=UPI0040412E89